MVWDWLLDGVDFALCTLDRQSLVTWDELIEDGVKSTIRAWEVTVIGRGLVTEGNFHWFVGYARSQGISKITATPSKVHVGEYLEWCGYSKSRERLYRRLGFVKDPEEGGLSYIID